MAKLINREPRAKISRLFQFSEQFIPNNLIRSRAQAWKPLSWAKIKHVPRQMLSPVQAAVGSGIKS